MKKSWFPILALIISLSPFFPAAAAEPLSLSLWTSEAGPALEYMRKLASEFAARDKKTAVEIKSLGAGELRASLQSAYLAGKFPDIVWASNELVGPFVAADFIQSVDSMVSVKDYVGVPAMDGKSWAVPLFAEGQLLLLYNKALLKKPPVSTQDLARLAGELRAGGLVPLAFDLSDPYCFAAFLGGFGGAVFSPDGRTPSLDSQAAREALAYFAELGKEGTVPLSSTWKEAEELFKAGNAAMLLDGDWSLPLFAGMDFGIASIPVVRKTLKRPVPYISGACLMVSKEVKTERLASVKALVRFLSSHASQVEGVKLLRRLPCLKSAFDYDLVVKDPMLKGLADQSVFALARPSAPEMGIVWSALKIGIKEVLSGISSPEEGAKTMQELAVSGIKELSR